MGIVIRSLLGESIIEQHPDKLIIDFAGNRITMPLFYTNATVIDGKYGSKLITGHSATLTSLVGEIISYDNSKAWLIYHDGFMELIDRNTMEVLEVNLIKDFNSAKIRDMKVFKIIGAYFDKRKGNIDIVFYNPVFRFITINRSDNTPCYIVKTVKKEHADSLYAITQAFSSYADIDDWETDKYDLKLNRNGETWFTNLAEVCIDDNL